MDARALLLVVSGSVVLSAACGDSDPVDTDPDTDPGTDTNAPPEFDLPVFVPPTLECREPRSGEPEGQSEGGQVCTWQSIAGATEQGRRFYEYADCDVVRTQRPYYPRPPNTSQPEPDPRLSDPAYRAEAGWVKAQVDATGCSCCHSADAPQGPARWSTDMPGNWVNSLDDYDLAAVAGLIDTSMFGRFPPEHNNGFARTFGIPSTDNDRMRAFFLAELSHRGREPEEFVDAPPTGGLLLEQAAYEPSPCEGGEGIDAEGVIHWSGGPARYIYVLAEGSENPTVPPDRDTPAGTRWRLDVPHWGEPLTTGAVRYGEVPAERIQRHPGQGQPEALVAGERYYLYVSRDYFQPITRCLFRAQ